MDLFISVRKRDSLLRLNLLLHLTPLYMRRYPILQLSDILVLLGWYDGRTDDVVRDRPYWALPRLRVRWYRVSIGSKDLTKGSKHYPNRLRTLAGPVHTNYLVIKSKWFLGPASLTTAARAVSSVACSRVGS